VEKEKKPEVGTTKSGTRPEAVGAERSGQTEGNNSKKNRIFLYISSMRTEGKEDEEGGHFT